MSSTRPDHSLFRTDPILSGMLKCAVCYELFQTAASLQSLITDLRAHGKSTKHLPTPETEAARRRQHAEAHVRRCEATLDTATGYFRLAEHLRPTPKPVTAADHGFKPETAL